MASWHCKSYQDHHINGSRDFGHRDLRIITSQAEIGIVADFEIHLPLGQLLKSFTPKKRKLFLYQKFSAIFQWEQCYKDKQLLEDSFCFDCLMVIVTNFLTSILKLKFTKYKARPNEGTIELIEPIEKIKQKDDRSNRSKTTPDRRSNAHCGTINCFPKCCQWGNLGKCCAKATKLGTLLVHKNVLDIQNFWIRNCVDLQNVVWTFKNSLTL